MEKCISFCLYGNNPKYYVGLVRNINDIQNKLPDYRIMLFVPKGYHFIPKYIDSINHYEDTGLLRIKYANDFSFHGAYLMFMRFMPASYSNVSIMHSRDLDSPILDRDVAVIRAFEKSNKTFLICRDHKYHTARILGGLWGAKQGAIPEMEGLINTYILSYPEAWYSDQHFLEHHVYDKVIKNALIYDSFRLYPDEKDIAQDFPLKRQSDEFCGMQINEDGSRMEDAHVIIKNSNTI